MGKYIEANVNNFKRYRQAIKTKKAKLRKVEVEESVYYRKRRKTSQSEGPGPSKRIRTYSYKNEEVSTEKNELYGKTESNVFFEDNSTLKLKNSTEDDLFFTDEELSCFENFNNKDFLFHLYDEIALEGLDGIALEALWKRLSICFKDSIKITEKTKKIFWKIICLNDFISFYELPVARHPLVLYNRHDYVNENGIPVDPDIDFVDIYPYSLVKNSNDRGSCMYYEQRKNVSENVRQLDLNTVEKIFGTTLVIVADQRIRDNALRHYSSDPCTDFMDIEYCILERIGRARWMGEQTQGKLSLMSTMIKDPKSIFHYQKQLVGASLIAKQHLLMMNVSNDKNNHGRLLQLTRFYTLIKPKKIELAEKIVNILKTKPGYKMMYTDLRNAFKPEHMRLVFKVAKSEEFRQVVETDVLVPWRDMYPDADITEWKCKAKNTEKRIRILELKDPHVNLIAAWGDDNDYSSDDDQPVEEIVGNKSINMDVSREVYHYIFNAGPEGVTLFNVSQNLEIEMYIARLTIKKLVAKNLVELSKIDIGKQRCIKYFARCHLLNQDLELKEETFKLEQDVLNKFRLKQIKAIQDSTNKEIYTLDQYYLDKIKVSTEFPKILNLEFDRSLKITWFKHEFAEKMDIESFNSVELSSFWKKGKQFVINLQFKQFISLITPKIINKIQEIILKEKYIILKTSNDFLVIEENVDDISKLLLFKYLFKELEFNKDIENVVNCLIESLNTKKCFTEVLNTSKMLDTSQDVSKKISRKVDLNLHYMGSNPTEVYQEENDDYKLQILESTPPESYVLENESYLVKNNELTDRVIKRLNYILKRVKKFSTIEDAHRLIKYIEEVEIKEGYMKKIDRKSLFRLYTKLITEGYIKIFKIILSNSIINKSLTFLCDIHVSYDNPVIRASIDQIKLRFFAGIQKKKDIVEEKIQKRVKPEKPEDVFETPELQESILKFKKVTEQIKEQTEEQTEEGTKEAPKSLKGKCEKYVGKCYGFKPKFIRLQIMHELLFYLIYDFTGRTECLQKDEIAELFRDFKIDLDDTDIDSFPPIYCKELSWKTFINRMPLHKDWAVGWALAADIFLRLPISIFLKLHNYNRFNAELAEFLQHPIKRHFPITTLPDSIKNSILANRKYLADLYDSLRMLVCMGLAQFGPQKNMNKDQVFIYLNKRASLMDTRLSEANYIKTSKKAYPVLKFEFKNQACIDQYWFNLWRIGMNTKLNVRKTMEGKTISYYKNCANKPQFREVFLPRKSLEAAGLDTGLIPGDQRGAAGLDSSMWVHIKKNWMWANRKIKGTDPDNIMDLRKERLDMQILSERTPYNQLTSALQSLGKVYLSQAPKKKIFQPKSIIIKKGNKKVTRKFLSRKPKARIYMDSIDLAISRKNGKTRPAWDSKEEQFLVLNKAANLLLNPKYPKQNCISFNIQRDILHIYNPKSRNKSSGSMKRRSYMLSLRLGDPMMKCAELNYTNLLDIKTIQKYFSYLCYYQIKEKEKDDKRFSDTEMINAYIFLMSYILKNMDHVERVLMGQQANLDYFSPENLSENFMNYVECDDNSYKDPKDVMEVRKEVLKSMIHSSLGNSDSEPGLAFRLFKLYQKFPDQLIREAINELKSQQIISKNRDVLNRHTPFQLSNFYVYMQTCTYTETSIVGSYESFVTLLKKEKDNLVLDFDAQTLENKKYSQMIALSEIFSFWDRIFFAFNLPDSGLILNPEYAHHYDLIEELAIRQQIKMRKLVENKRKDTEETNEENVRKNMKIEANLESAAQDPVDSKTLETEDIRNSPLDLTMDPAQNKETINKLKSWVSDCVTSKLERRSPSPEFLMFQNEETSLDEPNLNLENEAGTNELLELNKITAKHEDNTEVCDMEIELLTYDHYVEEREANYVPTLKEIKEAMMQPPSEENRKIPYITEMSNLLNRDAFPERDVEEDTLELLRKHFIPQFPEILDVNIDEIDEFENSFVVDYVLCENRNKIEWERICGLSKIRYPNMDVFEEKFNELSNNFDDLDLLMRIFNFANKKEVEGVTCQEIKDNFKPVNLELSTLIGFLVEHNILLKLGVCKLTFVHYDFSDTWLIDSIDDDENSTENEESEDKSVPEAVKIYVFPWTTIDGNINKKLFKKWLCCVLSHILDNPKITLSCIMEKYCYIKPVDIYCIIEILRNIGCIDLYVYESQNLNLWNDWKLPSIRPANLLDNFDDIFIDPNNLSMVTLGSFLSYINS